MIALVFLAAAVAQPTTSSSAMSVGLKAATVALADCYKSEIPQLDDGKSGADVIAEAVVTACGAQISAAETEYKKNITEVARSTEGLSKRERDKLAMELLDEMPQQFHDKLEKLALAAILRARASKE